MAAWLRRSFHKREHTGSSPVAATKLDDSMEKWKVEDMSSCIDADVSTAEGRNAFSASCQAAIHMTCAENAKQVDEYFMGCDDKQRPRGASGSADLF